MTEQMDPQPSSPIQQTGSQQQTTSAAIMEVTTYSVSNGKGACASPYPKRANDVTSKRMPIGSITLGIWEMAVKSAIRIASSRNKNNTADSTAEGRGKLVPTSIPQQKALPPLPAVPPVGPGGPRRQRSPSLTRSQSVNSKYPSTLRPSPAHKALARSHSMADVLSAMVAARLKPGNTLARSTHCQECNQRFSFIFRRHHCKTCRRSVCAYCSTYQILSSDKDDKDADTIYSLYSTQADSTSIQEGGGEEDGEEGGGEQSDVEESRDGKTSKSKVAVTPQSVLHRVCRTCAAELEGKQEPFSRSWTEEYCSLRQVFKQGRHVGCILDNHHMLPPKIPKLPQVCETIARSFLEECKKNAKNKSLFQATSASLNAGLYALKRPDSKLCNTCSKLLRFPVERKTCVLCDKIFCRNCSSRNLALSMPDNLDPGDVGHEMAQVNVRILTKEEADELDKHSNNAAAGILGIATRRYRACHECRDHVTHVLMVMNFNDTLTQIQAEMVDLQEQIGAVLDEQDTPSPGIGLTRWPSVRSVHAYTSVEDEIVGEAVNQRVAQKLLERYFQLYLDLEKLKPETANQGILLKHVKQAMSAFYVTRRSLSCKRFNNRDISDMGYRFPDQS